VGRPGLAQSRRRPGTGDTDPDTGTGAAPREDDVLAVTDDGDVGDVLDPEPDNGHEHQVRPRAAPRDVVDAQHEVGVPAHAQPVEDEPVDGLGEAGNQAHLHMRAGQLGYRFNRAGCRGQAEPVDDGPVGALEGDVGRLRLGVVLAEQHVHDVQRRGACGPVHLNHVPRVSGGAGNYSLRPDRLGERLLQDAPVGDDRSGKVTAHQRYGECIAHLLASSAGHPPGECASVDFARGGLGPEVNLGPVGLHLPPHGKDPNPQQDEHKQLLHGADLPR
jgi:hypothetical protein